MWNFLPEDVKMDCIARVPRCYYPTLSLVSKYFHSLVASPELYARRSLLGCTEYCFYVGFSDITSSYMNWYTFRRKTSKNMFGTDKNDNSLVLLPSLPYVPIHSSCVVVGSKIYMIGGYYYSKPTSDVSVINCISHTAQPLPRFRKNVADLAVGSVDEKIYVIDKYEDPRIMVFDTESLTWELGARSKVETGERVNGVAMSGKIYMSTAKNGYICHPNEGRWETDQIMNSKEWSDACVLDDILPWKSMKEERFWGMLNGVILCLYILLILYSV